MLMIVPFEYDDCVELLMTNPALLPINDKNNLEASGIKKSCAPNKSVLGDIGNRDQPGILKKEQVSRGSSNNVLWSHMVS